ncbi:MAG: hypothetical protein AB7C90_06755 [Bacteroidales bacterium]
MALKTSPKEKPQPQPLPAASSKEKPLPQPLPETLKALAKAMLEVETARTEPDLPQEERLLLERLSLQLRQTERDLMQKANADLVKLWKGHHLQLQGLTAEIRSAGRKLSGLTARLERVNRLLRDLLRVERALLPDS